MLSSEKNHFGKRVLDYSERAHQKLGHSALGRTVTRAIAGSSSPAYVQLNWYSRGVTADTGARAKVAGDPQAGPVPRFWNRAAVLASHSEDIERLKSTAEDVEHKEAVAYVSEGVWHVGIMASEGALFEELNERENAVAMRLGKGSLNAAMGIWIPTEKHFMGAGTIRTVDQYAYVRTFVADYPGLNLV